MAGGVLPSDRHAVDQWTKGNANRWWNRSGGEGRGFFCIRVSERLNRIRDDTDPNSTGMDAIRECFASCVRGGVVHRRTCISGREGSLRTASAFAGAGSKSERVANVANAWRLANGGRQSWMGKTTGSGALSWNRMLRFFQ